MAEKPTATETACAGKWRLRLVIDEATIRQRVREIGKQLSQRYAGQVPILIGILDGSFMFVADLVRSIEPCCEVTFWKVSSYGMGMVSSGHVTECDRPDVRVAGRHVIVVEDIVDSGLTLRTLLNSLSAARPASLAVVTLLHKGVVDDIQVDYVGFTVPDHYMVGYGLDYRKELRNLPCLYAMERVLD